MQWSFLVLGTPRASRYTRVEDDYSHPDEIPIRTPNFLVFQGQKFYFSVAEMQSSTSTGIA